MNEPGQVGGLRLARGTSRIGLVFMEWIDGDVIVRVRLNRTAQRAIAAACRKAVTSVTAANQRCHAGRRPRK